MTPVIKMVCFLHAPPAYLCLLLTLVTWHCDGTCPVYLPTRCKVPVAEPEEGA